MHQMGVFLHLLKSSVRPSVACSACQCFASDPSSLPIDPEVCHVNRQNLNGGGNILFLTDMVEAKSLEEFEKKPMCHVLGEFKVIKRMRKLACIVSTPVATNMKVAILPC